MTAPDTCPQGHDRATHGARDRTGHVYCRACAAARARRIYAARRDDPAYRARRNASRRASRQRQRQAAEVRA